ncbi:hypothetical protein AX14_007680 [Amanita brunnescens Koide BX004]|nr:hypothetical protein AX14_007680 [Amanita brunnescens Koide BX004]
MIHLKNISAMVDKLGQISDRFTFVSNEGHGVDGSRKQHDAIQARGEILEMKNTVKVIVVSVCLRRTNPTITLF